MRRTTVATTETTLTRRFSLLYRVALSSFTLTLGRPFGHLPGSDSNAAVGRRQLDRRPTAVHFSLDAAPRLLGDLHLDAGDVDAAVRAGRDHVGFRVFRQIDG